MNQEVLSFALGAEGDKTEVEKLLNSSSLNLTPVKVESFIAAKPKQVVGGDKFA